MVEVSSSMGRSKKANVTVVIGGLIETVNRLREYYKLLPTKEGIGVVKAADYVKSEVQESIIGNRGEPKSVDTGNFANSIYVMPVSSNSLSVKTDTDYAKFLEYGTSKMPARRHFNNSAARSAEKVKDIVKVEIDNAKKESFK